MDSLIGGPLNAAAVANAAMALTQTKFLLHTCFKDNGNGSYSPIMIVMSLTKFLLSDNTSKTVTTSFNLPLLTIVPLNSLAVDTVEVTFEMEVKSSFSDESKESSEKQIKAGGTFEGKAGWGPLSVSIKGSASYDQKDSSTHDTHYEKSNSAKYTVHVHAGQLPLPKGVNTIIEAFTKAIEPIKLPEESK